MPRFTPALPAPRHSWNGFSPPPSPPSREKPSKSAALSPKCWKPECSGKRTGNPYLAPCNPTRSHRLPPSTPPRNCLHLRRHLEGKSSLTDFDLLLACASAPDCEPVLPVDFEDLENLAEELARQTSRLLANSGHHNLSVGGKRLLSALKTCIVLWRWTVIGDEESVAEEDGVYPFEIFRLIETMDRLLLASASIQKLIDHPVALGIPEEVSEEKAAIPKSHALLRIELLRQKVLNGIEGPAASLTFVDGIGSTWARKLSSHGIPDLTALAQASVDKLTSLSGISAKRAAKWIANARASSLQVPPPVDAPRVPTFPPDHDMTVDPYRLRRAWISKSRAMEKTDGRSPVDRNPDSFNLRAMSSHVHAPTMPKAGNANTSSLCACIAKTRKSAVWRYCPDWARNPHHHTPISSNSGSIDEKTCCTTPTTANNAQSQCRNHRSGSRP